MVNYKGCDIPNAAVKAQTSVPSDKREKMIAYAKELRRKFPHMKKERIAKKTAEYFKVKLT